MKFAENVVRILGNSYNCRKILKDLDHGSKCLDKNEASLTKDLKETLEIIKVGATALSRHNVTPLE